MVESDELTALGPAPPCCLGDLRCRKAVFSRVCDFGYSGTYPWVGYPGVYYLPEGIPGYLLEYDPNSQIWYPATPEYTQYILYTKDTLARNTLPVVLYVDDISWYTRMLDISPIILRRYTRYDNLFLAINSGLR